MEPDYYAEQNTTPKNGKTLRNLAFASLAVGLLLTLLKDFAKIRGPYSGGNASNFSLLFLSSLFGRAVACMILPSLVFVVTKIYSILSKKPAPSLFKTLWAIWIVTVAMSVLGQFIGR